MKRKALFVGVNRYEDTQIRDLKYSLRDAHFLRAIFESLGFQTDVLEDPERNEVFRAVKEFTSDLGPDDLFLFYFAGHGWTTSSGKHLLFCTDDMYEDLRDDDAGVYFDKLKRKTEAGGFDRAFVLDACRSDFLAGARGSDSTTRDMRPIAELAKNAGRKSSLAVLRSCSKYEHAIELDSRRQGLFTLAMIDVIKSAQESGSELFFAEAFCDAVSERMGQIARLEGVVLTQTPEYAKSGKAPRLIDGKPCTPDGTGFADKPHVGGESRAEKPVAGLSERDDATGDEVRLPGRPVDLYQYLLGKCGMLDELKRFRALVMPAGADRNAAYAHCIVSGKREFVRFVDSMPRFADKAMEHQAEHYRVALKDWLNLHLGEYSGEERRLLDVLYRNVSDADGRDGI